MKTAIDCTTLWSTALLLVLMGRDGWVVKVEREGRGRSRVSAWHLTWAR